MSSLPDRIPSTEPTGPIRLILASASPARLTLLSSAGLHPEVRVSHVDEAAAQAALEGSGRAEPRDIAQHLALHKAEVIAEELRAEFSAELTTLIVGCDSVLDFEGEALGKPHDAEDAINRWRNMRGRMGQLCTGHAIIRLGQTRDEDELVQATEATFVQFAAIDDDTISAYVNTGEPLRVAGGCTLDGIGGPFIEFIEGDWSNVVGLSLPLMRHLVSELGIAWTQLWTRP
jgi:septum formation protein